MKHNIGFLASAAILIGLLIFWPALAYFAGWVSGLLLKWIIGDIVANGFNYVFNTTRFTADMLPVTCGVLGVIGSFFKNSSTTDKRD